MKKLFLLSGLLLAGCAALAPGADPLVVRTEQLEATAYNTFAIFLKFDDIAMDNSATSNAWSASAHPFATYLRRPILNGTNIIPFGIATIMSLDQIKISYKAGTASSNALTTAITTLSATVAQVQQYTSIINTNK